MVYKARTYYDSSLGIYDLYNRRLIVLRIRPRVINFTVERNHDIAEDDIINHGIDIQLDDEDFGRAYSIIINRTTAERTKSKDENDEKEDNRSLSVLEEIVRKQLK